jgi:hypothetical protein
MSFAMRSRQRQNKALRHFSALYKRRGGKAMAQDWPMFIMQCIVLAGLASVFLVRGEGD